MPKIEIREGTDQYSLFRALTTLMLFIICFGIVWNVHQVQINRKTGYHNRAVSCATLQGARQGLAAQGQSDDLIEQIYKIECASGQVKDLYPNANASK